MTHSPWCPTLLDHSFSVQLSIETFSSDNHLEMYCFRTNNMMVNGGTGTHIQPERCSHWNCADEQCSADRQAYEIEVSALKPKERPEPIPPLPPPPPVKTFIVFFDFDKSNLTDASRSVVAEAVRTAKANRFTRVRVIGHTDTVGTDIDDQRLSLSRAQIVRDEMVRDGVIRRRIRAEGRSFHEPLVPTPPNVREPQNNRVIIDFSSTP